MMPEVALNPKGEALPRSPLRIFISTGEVSGDLQGALLIAALQRQAQTLGLELEIVALGGDRMAAAGATLLGDTTRIGSVGILESLPYVWPTVQLQRRVKAALRQSPPDLVILIDYMGPNIGIGDFVRQSLPQVPMVYYIAPQEWVWSISSVNTRRIVNISDRLLAVFPEEARYFERYGAAVTWVGHPFVDQVTVYPDRATARSALGLSQDQPVVALIPASRRQELKYLLPIVLEAARQIQAQTPDVQFLLPLAQSQYQKTIEAAIQASGVPIRLVAQQTQRVIAAADVAITKSGTVNLEIALMNVPQVVCYRVNPLTAWIAKHILKFAIPFAAPPNLVLMKPVVPEFLQWDATAANLSQATLELLQNSEKRQKILEGYQEMRQALGEPGVCDRAASAIFELLIQKTQKTSEP